MTLSNWWCVYKIDGFIYFFFCTRIKKHDTRTRVCDKYGLAWVTVGFVTATRIIANLRRLGAYESWPMSKSVARTAVSGRIIHTYLSSEADRRHTAGSISATINLTFYNVTCWTGSDWTTNSYTRKCDKLPFSLLGCHPPPSHHCTLFYVFLSLFLTLRIFSFRFY